MMPFLGFVVVVRFVISDLVFLKIKALFPWLFSKHFVNSSKTTDRARGHSHISEEPEIHLEEQQPKSTWVFTVSWQCFPPLRASDALRVDIALWHACSDELLDGGALPRLEFFPGLAVPDVVGPPLSHCIPTRLAGVEVFAGISILALFMTPVECVLSGIIGIGQMLS